MMHRRGANAAQHAHDKWIIDQLVAGPLKARVARKRRNGAAPFDAKEGRALQQAIQKCWAPGSGGLPGF